MERYEKQIGLKTIYLTLVRRYLYIALIFLPILLISFLATRFMITKTYSSTVTITKNAVFTQAHYDTLKGKVNDSIASTVEALKETKHSDGTDITANDVAGVSYTAFVNNKYDFVITLTGKDSTVLKPILTELANEAVSKCYTEKEGVKTPISGFEGTIVKGGEASNATDASGSKKYFLIGAAAGLVLALGIPFVYEIISDEVWDKKDLEDLGIPAFEVKAGK